VRRCLNRPRRRGEGVGPPWWPAGAPWPEGARRRSLRRRRPFFIWTIVGLAWAAYAIAYGAIGLVRVVLGPAAIGRGPLLPLPLIILVVVFVAAAVVILFRGVGSPLGEVVEASERVASGDLGVRVREQGPPWLRTVARAFNSMTSRLELQHRQRRELMADVAHELRTPLTAMQGRLEGMLDGVYPHDEAQVAQVLQDTRMLAGLVEDLRTLAHSESGGLVLHRESTDLGALVEEAAATFHAAADRRQVTVSTAVAGDLPAVSADAPRIREVVANLLANALRYSPAGATVSVVVEPAADGVAVTVSDMGPGAAAEDLPRLFDRFFKGSSSNGSGLGLTIARNLVTAHGGTITAGNRDGGGLSVRFILPLG
jgi:two-component system OmpR family sensor kinase/two-component system sensor histidine kinase BaeS